MRFIICFLAFSALALAQTGNIAMTPHGATASAGPITYRIETGRVEMAILTKRFTPEQMALLEKLNRADVAHLPRMRQLVIPDRFDLDELAYSPLPQEYPSAKDTFKAIVVHLPGQVMGAYEYGKLVRWAPISSGSDVLPTPEGFHHLNWKSKGRASTENSKWYMNWYFNFQNTEGRAFHELEMPGYPASHSCIRMLKRDAMWLYEWGVQWKLDPTGTTVAEPGTPVFLVGQYDFESYYPWRVPEWLSAPVTLPPLPQSSQLNRL
jgi:lipoprotein-anchoring transpeptidase ErfK/SrfK